MTLGKINSKHRRTFTYSLVASLIAIPVIGLAWVLHVNGQSGIGLILSGITVALVVVFFASQISELVLVCENGVSLTQWGKVRSALFDHIESVRLVHHGTDPAKLTICTKSGTRIVTDFNWTNRQVLEDLARRLSHGFPGSPATTVSPTNLGYRVGLWFRNILGLEQ